MLDRFISLFPARDAGAYRLVFQYLLEPVGTVAAIPEQTIDIRQIVAKRLRTDVVANPLPQ